MNLADKITAVVLAGGKGTRMQSDTLPKVCFPLDGQPVINRLIATLQSAGIQRIVVVVGDRADQVRHTIEAEFPEVSYVVQDQPRGTGHAARLAVDWLQAQGDTRPILITMGDKYLAPAAVPQLCQAFVDRPADLMLAVSAGGAEPGAGRVVSHRWTGKVLAVVETGDLERARLQGTFLTIAGARHSAAAVEAMPGRQNLALYLGRAGPLALALRGLNCDNAKGEYYLTDIVAALAGNPRYRVESCELESGLVRGFNTQEELQAIEADLQRQAGAG